MSGLHAGGAVMGHLVIGVAVGYDRHAAWLNSPIKQMY